MSIPTATKIAIIATSRNVLAHAHIDNSYYIIIFFHLKKNKQINTRNKSAYGLERFNTFFSPEDLFSRRTLLRVIAR